MVYCIGDVNVLRQACCAFMNSFLKLVKITPLGRVSLSSICSKVFRTMILKSDTAGIIPRGGTEWEITSMLKPFSGWRALVG